MSEGYRQVLAGGRYRAFEIVQPVEAWFSGPTGAKETSARRIHWHSLIEKIFTKSTDELMEKI